MSETPSTTSADVAMPQGRVLRRLFLTLFLRGRGARGVPKDPPKSVARKLWMTLLLYAAFGMISFAMISQPTLTLAVYLHAMTMVFLGTFVASTAGEVLFNEAEADILLHRPVNPRSLLWAKVGVLVQVSLWLGLAFNLAGCFAGAYRSRIGLGFAVVHAGTACLMAVFCTAAVVMVYQLCLRWFGRERLEGVMTTAQVLVSIGALLGGQLVPQLMMRIEGAVELDTTHWGLGLLPPMWFAGLDDALAGSGSRGAWLLGAIGLAVTAGVVGLAFGKLARDYEGGLQTLNERAGGAGQKGVRGRWLKRLVRMPPLRWWLPDPVSRASFVLTAVYLSRDRDVKLRVYPGIAPLLIMPIIFLMQDLRSPAHGILGRNAGHSSGFGIVFAVAYAAMVPMMAVQLMQYSQQWQAAEVFRMAPLGGPARVMDGARRAVVLFIGLPVVAALVGIVAVVRGGSGGGGGGGDWVLLIPGLLAMPVFARAANWRGGGVPLSEPTDAAKGTGRGLRMLVMMLAAMLISGAALAARYLGVFWWMLAGECVVMGALYAVMRWRAGRAVWAATE